MRGRKKTDASKKKTATTYGTVYKIIGTAAMMS